MDPIVRYAESRDFHPATGGPAVLVFETLPPTAERPRVVLGIFDTEEQARRAFPDAFTEPTDDDEWDPFPSLSEHGINP